LYPLVQRDESEADTVLKNSLGVFGSADAGYMQSVLDALKTYVDGHNGLDCGFIHNIACSDRTATTSTAVTSITAIFTSPPGMVWPTYSPSATPQPSVVGGEGTYFPTYLPSVTARPTASGVLDGGVIAVSDGTVSAPLYSGAYTPTSNIDHM
jgi:hypothetical protein